MQKSEFYDLVVPLVKDVGAFQKQHLNSDFKVEYKSQINLLTEIDKASEDKIVTRLSQAYPDHDILAEEGGGERKDSAYKWIIDPLDGTTNFAHGYPVFAVSVALEHEGRVLGGAVYNPCLDELFMAFRGEGALFNEKPLQVSSTPDLSRSLVGTGFAYNLNRTYQGSLGEFQAVLLKAQGLRRDGSAALDLCHVACGRYDAFFERDLFPWDTAAGFLIVQEAGGKVTRYDGSSYSAYEKDILASNGLVHDEVVQCLASVS